MWMLIAIAGPDKGQAHPLDAGATREHPMVLGREGDPFRLSDKRASRRHAGLFRENGRWCIDDLGSTTGTLRNHKLVEGTQALKEGDFLQVGKTVLTLSRMDHAPLPVGAMAGAPVPAGPARRNLAGWVLGSGSAAAVVVIGLGVLNQHQVSRLTAELRDTASTQTADRAEAEARAAERIELAERRLLASQEAHGQTLAGEIAIEVGSLRPEFDRTAEALARVGLVVDQTADEAQRLARGLETRDEALVGSLADATARRLRPALSPLPGELAEELRSIRAQVAALPTELGPQLEGLGEAVAAGQAASDRAQQQLLAAVDAAADGLEERLPTRDQLDARFARVEERLERLPDAAALDARLAAVTEALEQRPADPADAQRFEELRTTLAAIAADLKERPDAAALRSQLEAVAARESVEPDPILAQVLAGMARQQAATARVEAELARAAEADAARESFDAEALAARVVAALPESQKLAAVTGTPGPQVALDPAAVAAAVESALAGTALASAESLRDVIRGEVSIALKAAGANAGFGEGPSNGQIDRASLERAYRLAFETGRKRVLPGGRVLDPEAARAAGVNSWRDWYLIDEFAERMRLIREASRVRATLPDPSVISLPSR